ncbi:dihydrodipicolinate reductase [Candidatus Bathyarchaeota archaeon]|nr:dihydrodipicolinate reductase [Candidatus Bathyarchaeota archaeon]
MSYGIGVIGRRLATHLLTKEGVEIVGAVDINSQIVGKDLGEVLGGKKIGVVISNDADKVLEKTKPDVVVHTTMSYLRQTHGQFEQILKHGVSIVSTCEELGYPYATEEGTKYAKELDKVAKKYGATLLGTGINPGFLMDILPTFLTGPCEQVETIYVSRQMNAATRRIPFQKKIGAGMTKEEFRKAIDSGKITGHVGLEQSIQMISDSLGWELDEIKVDPPQAVILDHDAASDAIKVPKGKNAGSMQMAYGIMGGKAVITMDFKAYIGAPEEFDGVDIEGVPPIHQRISPCVHGDHGTIAMTTNMIPLVINAEPGLKTMADLPVVHATPVHFGKYIKK